MTLEDRTRDELIARLQALLNEAGVEKREHERLLHELQVHQLELELQNRDLRDAQNALEQSRNRYADLYDFAPIAYFTFDARGCIDEVNLTGATLIGRDRQELIGLPFPALVRLAEPPRFWAHLRRCAEARGPVVAELALTARNVSLQLRVVSSPVTDPAGHPVAFRTAFVDITDRHLAEAARDDALAAEQTLRRELEALDQANTVLARSLATVTEHSLTAILQVAVDQARMIADAEYAALGIDHSPDATFKVWVYSGIEPALAAAIGRHPRAVGTLGAVIRDKRTLRVKSLPAHPAFSGFPAHHPAMTSFLGVPVWFGDRLVGNMYLTNKRGADEFSVSDQRAIESLTRYVGAAMEIARLSDEAQEAIHARDNLLATVSHELRSPLSAITISSKLLLRLSRSTEQVAVGRQAETIGRAADRMRRFIEDLLTASTIEAGRLTVATRPERIEPIIAEASDMFASVVAESSLQLDTQVPAGLPEVLCDRDRIHQVLANLVGNAAKFTPPGGRITIEVEQRGDQVQISVVDTGPGIPTDMLTHVFERYWKGDPANSRRGVGLGLYICKGIVESHGGQIWIESTPGAGARFSFTIPIAASPRP